MVVSMERTYNASQIESVLRKMVKQTSFRRTAAELGVTAAYVSDILKHRRGLSERVARALGFEPIASPRPPAQLYTRKSRGGAA
jgi:phenylalanyl-tRNA synthetase beta subunit